MSRNKREGRYAGKFKAKHYRTFQIVDKYQHLPWAYLAYSESMGAKIVTKIFKIKLW